MKMNNVRYLISSLLLIMLCCASCSGTSESVANNVDKKETKAILVKDLIDTVFSQAGPKERYNCKLP